MVYFCHNCSVFVSIVCLHYVFSEHEMIVSIADIRCCLVFYHIYEVDFLIRMELIAVLLVQLLLVSLHSPSSRAIISAL